MNLRESVKISFRALSVNKARSALTMLGIIIGVGAVVAMISIGAGATSAVTGSIQGLGSNLLTVTPGAASTGGVRSAQGTRTTLTRADADAIKKSVPGVKEVSPEMSRNAQIVYADKNANSSVAGVTPTYEQVRNFHIEYGTFIGTEDVETASRVVVLGQTVVSSLFETGDDPIGKIIKINGIPFRVVGVMEKKGTSGFMNMDDTAIIPLSTAMNRLFGSRTIQQIGVEVSQADMMDSVSAEITNLLLIRHKIIDPDKADFSIMNQATVLDMLTQVTGTLTLLLGGIAAISLLVGGIGIMNIMLVSVTERTREIGLRKAVGAKRKNILFQFLVESLILCLVGGAIGILLGLGGSAGIGAYAGWGTIIAVNAIWLAFLFSAAVGLFFGIYPAVKASRLNPIDALRYE